MVYNIRRILLESYPTLLVSALISLSAGYVLNMNIKKIEAVPLILMMVPPINGIGGNVGSILGARLASALHMGTVEPSFRRQPALSGNIRASIFMSIGVFSFASAVFLAIAYTLGAAPGDSIKLMFTLFIAGIMLIPVIVLSTVALAFVSFAKGLDPDNVVIPIITSIIDFSGVTCLLIAVKVIGV